MQPADPEPRFSWRGASSLVVAIAVVLILIIGWPAYRLFFAISVAIGVVVAGILYLWHRLRPLKPEDIENKRPLGL